MYTLLKRFFLFTISLGLVSCEIFDYNENCGIYLEFIFDYNMEYADSFDPQVETVDVYIFDEEGIYLSHQYAKTSELINRKQMRLDNKLPYGTYRFITVGGMSDYFRFTDRDNKECIPGVTNLEEVKLSLLRTSNQVSHEFPHLWFGETGPLRFQARESVWPVYLVRNTNKFHMVLQSLEDKPGQQNPATAPYTFEIVTPEGTVYGYDNSPLLDETVTYHPFYLMPGEEAGSLSAGKLNTMRLFANKPGYRLVIRSSIPSQEEVWSYDLMNLLDKTRPFTRPDGLPLSMQEYLDRQGEWNIVILHRGGTPESGEGFVALAIEVNGWILWLNDIEV